MQNTHRKRLTKQRFTSQVLKHPFSKKSNPLNHIPIGAFIEVWGSQVMGGRGTAGSSTYAIDGSLSKNPVLQTGNTTEFVKLFSASNLPFGTHTLTITNIGVHLTIGYFKVQKIGIGSLAPGPALASIKGIPSPITSTISISSSEVSRGGTSGVNISCYYPI